MWVDVRSIIIYEGERLKETRCFLKFSFLLARVRFKPKKCGKTTITIFNKVLETMKTAKKAISPKKAKSLSKERSLPKKKQNLAPWLRILDEAEKRHKTQLNALINEYEGNGDKMWPSWKPRTLFFLFTEKS